MTAVLEQLNYKNVRMAILNLFEMFDSTVRMLLWFYNLEKSNHGLRYEADVAMAISQERKERRPTWNCQTRQ